MKAATRTVTLSLSTYEALRSGTVTIPKIEYLNLRARLLFLEDKLAESPLARNPGHGGTTSKIERDKEVKAFVMARLGTIPVQDIATACRRSFGPERAPSRSSIHRFWVLSNARRTPLK